MKDSQQHRSELCELVLDLGQALDEDEDVVFLQSAFPDGRRCSPGLLSEELHAVRGETRVRPLHGRQHHHVQRNVFHAGNNTHIHGHLGRRERENHDSIWFHDIILEHIEFNIECI